MRERVVDLLEKIDLAVAESEGVLDPVHLERVLRLSNDIRTRLAYPDDVMIVGLVGGTGSGKSSLINAVAGREISAIGSIRPTTAEPVALVPVHRLEALAGYLDEVGVALLVPGEHEPHLCMIDLPDIDSVELSHLQTVEDLMPRLDVVAWVVDPEKYRDANVHRPIVALAGYQSQFVFVFNQIDRLADGDRELVVRDFKEALADDGIDEPDLFLTAANPASGPPTGIEELVAGLMSRDEGSAGVYGKLVRDVATAAAELSALAGGASGLDFERRWAGTMETVSAQLADNQRAEVAHAFSSLMTDLARESGDLTEGELRRLSGVAHGVVEGSDGVDATIEGLNELVAAPARAVLRRRARCHAAIAELALAASNSRSK